MDDNKCVDSCQRPLALPETLLSYWMWWWKQHVNWVRRLSQTMWHWWDVFECNNQWRWTKIQFVKVNSQIIECTCIEWLSSTGKQKHVMGWPNTVCWAVGVMCDICTMCKDMWHRASACVGGPNTAGRRAIKLDFWMIGQDTRQLCVSIVRVSTEHVT